MIYIIGPSHIHSTCIHKVNDEISNKILFNNCILLTVTGILTPGLALINDAVVVYFPTSSPTTLPTKDKTGVADKVPSYSLLSTDTTDAVNVFFVIVPVPI